MIKSFGMKKLFLLFLFMLFAGAINAQVAVMDFDNEAGLSTKEMTHLADTLTDCLLKTEKFNVIGRYELEQEIKKQGFKPDKLSNNRIAKVGKALGANTIILGSIDSIHQDYHIVTYALDVKTGEIIATIETTKTPNSTYQETMNDIAEQFSNLIIIKEDEHHLNNDTIPDFRKKGLCFFPEIGFSCPLPEDFDIAPFGPIIILGMGYQFNPHWLLGISAGYGGNVRDYKTFRIGSDIRFYCVKRKNSLFLDFGTGYATEYNGVYFSLSIGYAIKRLEIDTKLYFDGCASASIDFRYRFNFKR